MTDRGGTIATLLRLERDIIALELAWPPPTPIDTEGYAAAAEQHRAMLDRYEQLYTELYLAPDGRRHGAD